MSKPCCSPVPSIVLYVLVSNPAERSATTLAPNSSFAKSARAKIASAANSFFGKLSKSHIMGVLTHKIYTELLETCFRYRQQIQKCVTTSIGRNLVSVTKRPRDRICCSILRFIFEAAVCILPQTSHSCFAPKSGLATPPTLPKRSRTSVSGISE